jgi:hypothetical protein
MNTRFNYDTCRTIKKNQESTDPGRYVLNVPGNGEFPYYINDPQILLQKFGANLRTNSTNLESQLLGLDQILTKNNLVSCSNKPSIVSSSPIQYPSSNFLTTEQSRATVPAWIFRELPQNNFQYLPLNPQENVCLSFQNNLSTRILEKDYFIPQIDCIGVGNDASLVYTKNYNNNYKNK